MTLPVQRTSTIYLTVLGYGGCAPNDVVFTGSKVTAKPASWRESWCNGGEQTKLESYPVEDTIVIQKPK